VFIVSETTGNLTMEGGGSKKLHSPIKYLNNGYDELFYSKDFGG
jgi:hypothetical protein